VALDCPPDSTTRPNANALLNRQLFSVSFQGKTSFKRFVVPHICGFVKSAWVKTNATTIALAFQIGPDIAGEETACGLAFRGAPGVMPGEFASS
jgi:hypothetical protein